MANPLAGQYFGYLTGKLGFTPTQAAALIGNIQQESSFNPTEYNKGEGAFGLIQWRGDRLAGLQRFAAQQGTSPSDWQTQLDYIKQEMAGPEAKNSTGFMAAQTLPDANAALKPFIRYGDNSEGTRLSNANAFLGNPLPPGGPAPSLPPPTEVASAAPQQPSSGVYAPPQQDNRGLLSLAALGNQMMQGSPQSLAAPSLIPAMRQQPNIQPLLAFLQSRNMPSGWTA